MAFSLSDSSCAARLVGKIFALCGLKEYFGGIERRQRFLLLSKTGVRLGTFGARFEDEDIFVLCLLVPIFQSFMCDFMHFPATIEPGKSDTKNP